MATRADFYIQHKNGVLEFLGSTVNDYDGDFENAKTVSEYRNIVLEKLKENNSVPGKWYWPWKNSIITDEVFIFRNIPYFFNKDKGVLFCKTYHRKETLSGNILGIIDFNKRKKTPQDEDGYYSDSMIEFIEMPNLKNQNNHEKN